MPANNHPTRSDEVRLNNEQKTRLDTLIAELESLPLAERIAESARLRCPLLLDEAGIKRMQRALAGAFAAQRILYYLESLRAIDVQRAALNASITEGYQQEQDAIGRAEVSGAAQARVRCTYLSGLLEVQLHQFAVCAWRIAVLLPIATRSAGTKVEKDDMDVLNSYEHLRHHFEHIEQRLPGGKFASEYVQVERTGEFLRVVAGFEVDPDGRFVINGTKIDVTTRGLREIERILQLAYEAMAVQVVEAVRKHFEMQPNEIPDPSDISQNLLFSTWTPDLLPDR